MSTTINNEEDSFRRQTTNQSQVQHDSAVAGAGPQTTIQDYDAAGS